jgi:hypothetical protein
MARTTFLRQMKFEVLRTGYVRLRKSWGESNKLATTFYLRFEVLTAVKVTCDLLVFWVGE